MSGPSHAAVLPAAEPVVPKPLSQEEMLQDYQDRRSEILEAMTLVCPRDFGPEEAVVLLVTELDNLLRVLGIEKVVRRYIDEAKVDLADVISRLACRAPIPRGSVAATAKAEAAEKLEVKKLEEFEAKLMLEVHALCWLNSGTAGGDAPATEYVSCCELCSGPRCSQECGLGVDAIMHHLRVATMDGNDESGLPKKPKAGQRGDVAGRVQLVNAGGGLMLSLRRNLMQRLASLSQVPLYRQGFEIFDLNGNGTIDKFEFSMVLKGFGHGANNDELDTLFQDLDVDGDNQVTFKEFVTYMAEEESLSSCMVEVHLVSLLRLYRMVSTAGQLEAAAPVAPVREIHSSKSVHREIAEISINPHLLEEDVETDKVPEFWDWSGLELALKVFSLEAGPDEETRAMETLFTARQQLHDAAENDDTIDPCNLRLCEFVQLILIDPSHTIIKFVEELRTCQEVFALFDEDGSGQISAAELGVALTKLFRQRPTQFEMQKLIETVDKDGSGVIDFCEFVHMLHAPTKNKSVVDVRKKILDPIGAIHEVFELFCVEPNSHFGPRQIQTRNFGKLMRCLGNEWADEEIRSLVNEIEPNGTGEITFGSFANTFTQCKESRVYQIVTEQYGMLQKLFQLFDDDGSGLIGVDELKRIVERLGKHPAPDEIAELISHVDYTNDGEIGFLEFAHMIAGDATPVQRFIAQQMQEFRQAFSLFDPDGGGSITSGEFRKVMKMFGEGAGKHTSELLQKIDEDGDGEVDFVEFVGLMASDDSTIQANLRSQLVSFRELFNLFDESGEGQITAEKFAYALKTLGVQCDEGAVIQMIIEGDQDGDGMLDFTEFVCLLSDSTAAIDMSVISQLSEMREAFSMYDTDGSGTLELDEIHSTLVALGQNVSLEQAKAMMDTVDTSGDGELDFREFLQMMCLTSTTDDDGGVPMAVATDHYKVLETLLMVPLEDRRKNYGPRVFQVVKENLEVPFFKDLLSEAGAMLCQDMQLVKVAPEELIYAQGDFAFEFNVILGGKVDIYQRSETWNEWQRIAGSKDSVWEVVNHVVLELMVSLGNILARLPSEGLVKYTAKTTELVISLSKLVKGWFKWHKETSKYVTNDLHDIRTLPFNMRQGLMMYETTQELIVTADEVRRENLLKQSNLQMQINCGEEGGDLGKAPAYLENAQDMLSAMKDLLGVLHGAQASMKNVFVGDIPEDHIYVGKRKPSLTEELELEKSLRHHPKYGGFLGMLQVPHSFGDIGFKGGEDATWPVTVVAAKDETEELSEAQKELSLLAPPAVKGVVLARVSRRQWRQALIKEPLEFISGLPYFCDLTIRQLEDVATQAQMRKVSRTDTLIRAGDKATEIFLVKSGQLKVCVELEAPPSPRKGPQQSPRRKRRKSIALVGSLDMVFEGDEDGPGEHYTANMVADSQEVVVYALPVTVLSSYLSILRRYLGMMQHRETIRMNRIETTQSVIGKGEPEPIYCRPRQKKPPPPPPVPPKVVVAPRPPSGHSKAVANPDYSKAAKFPLKRKDEIADLNRYVTRTHDEEIKNIQAQGMRPAAAAPPMQPPPLKIGDVNEKAPFERSPSPVCTTYTSWAAYDPSRVRSPFGYKEPQIVSDKPGSRKLRQIREDSASVPLAHRPAKRKPQAHKKSGETRINGDSWLKSRPSFEMQPRGGLPMTWKPMGLRTQPLPKMHRAQTPTFLVPMVTWKSDKRNTPVTPPQHPNPEFWVDGMLREPAPARRHRVHSGTISGWGCEAGQTTSPPSVIGLEGQFSVPLAQRVRTGLGPSRKSSPLPPNTAFSTMHELRKPPNRMWRPKMRAPLFAALPVDKPSLNFRMTI